MICWMTKPGFFLAVVGKDPNDWKDLMETYLLMTQKTPTTQIPRDYFERINTQRFPSTNYQKLNLSSNQFDGDESRNAVYF